MFNKMSFFTLKRADSVLCSLRASSPIWANEAGVARTRERGPRKGELATISHKLSFPPRKPRTPQNVKTVTANVAQIRKVTTACQVSLDSRGHVEFFIYKSLSQQHQSNVFNHWYVFFSTGTLPWVPEIFLACSGNFRCWPKAHTSSAVDTFSRGSL